MFPAPVAIAVANAHIGVHETTVEWIIGYSVIEIDIVILLPEATDSRHQPKRRKRGRCGKGNVGAKGAVPELLAKPSDLLKTRTQRLEQIDALGGQFNAAMQAQEQRAIEFAFERLYLSADRAQSDAEFTGGGGKTAVTRAGVERVEPGKARQLVVTACHQCFLDLLQVK
jgi:hypothetical protein